MAGFKIKLILQLSMISPNVTYIFLVFLLKSRKDVLITFLKMKNRLDLISKYVPGTIAGVDGFLVYNTLRLFKFYDEELK